MELVLDGTVVEELVLGAFVLRRGGQDRRWDDVPVVLVGTWAAARIPGGAGGTRTGLGSPLGAAECILATLRRCKASSRRDPASRGLVGSRSVSFGPRTLRSR